MTSSLAGFRNTLHQLQVVVQVLYGSWPWQQVVQVMILPLTIIV
jgi:hypothetical protein